MCYVYHIIHFQTFLLDDSLPCHIRIYSCSILYLDISIPVYSLCKMIILPRVQFCLVYNTIKCVSDRSRADLKIKKAGINKNIFLYDT